MPRFLGVSRVLKALNKITLPASMPGRALPCHTRGRPILPSTIAARHHAPAYTSITYAPGQPPFHRAPFLGPDQFAGPNDGPVVGNRGKAGGGNEARIGGTHDVLGDTGAPGTSNSRVGTSGKSDGGGGNRPMPRPVSAVAVMREGD